MLRVRFDRGTFEVEGDTSVLAGAVLDPRSASRRVLACDLGAVIAACDARGWHLEGDPRERWPLRRGPRADLGLRPYQEAALDAWLAFGRRGIVVLPTGAGKTRVAVAALRETGLPAAVLCPTRALASQWITELERWLGEEIGVVADGSRVIRRVTVLTFESAYRQMDRFGDRFGLVVVDEAHHLGGGLRVEALEATAATARLGLSATMPETSPAQERLVGPVVFEQSLASLVGRHLAPIRIVREHVSLDAEEAAAHARLVAPFRELARRFYREHGASDFATLSRALAGSVEGRQALRARAAAEALASFPARKRQRVVSLLAHHRGEKTIVFTAFAADAYTVARDNLVPVISAETSARERADVLRRFRDGPLRAIVAARVLNEGIDVPDAAVAIVVAGTLGQREHIQRVGRVLRPSPGKVALVHELVTRGTSDARRAQKREIDALRAVS